MKHENFVELQGYCVEGNLRLVAYEFATMGSLHDILHGISKDLHYFINSEFDLTDSGTPVQVDQILYQF